MVGSDSAAPPAITPESRIRFQITVQKSRAGLYVLAFLVGLAGLLAGFWKIAPWQGVALVGFGLLSAWLFARLQRRGFEERTGVSLAPFWMGLDVLILTFVIYLSGGIDSPFFIWYLANTGAAAFVGGMPACFLVIAADTAAYLGVLTAMGQIKGLDSTFMLALSRMAFLYGASFFFLRGVTKLREKQRLIRELRQAERSRMEELSRLTAELDAANAALRELSLTDPLTGLHNRRFLEERIREDVAAVRRHYIRRRRGESHSPDNADLGFLIVDLDDFKQINDRHGHVAGDGILRQLADVLRTTLRQHDTIIRWGGEEFLVVVRHTNGAFLSDVAERIVSRIAGEAFSLPSGGRVRLTCSVGWSYYPFGSREADLLGWQEVVRLADAALYLAKHGGRDLAVGLVPGAASAESVDAAQLLADVCGAVAASRLAVVSRREVPLSAVPPV